MSIPDKRNVQSPWRRLARGALRGFAGLILAIFLLLLAGYTAILLHPQGVSHLAQIGLARLQPRLAPYRLTVAEVNVRAVRFGAPVTVEALGLRCEKTDKLLMDAASLRAELGFDLAPFPRLRLKDLVLQSPVLHAGAALENDEAAAPSGAELRARWQSFKQRMDRWQRLVAFGQLRVQDGRIAMEGDGNPPGLWDMALSYHHRKLDGQLHAEWPQEEEPAQLVVTLQGKPFDDSAQITGKLTHLRPARLHGVPMPDWLRGIDYPISMQWKGEWKENTLERLDATLDGEAGSFTWPAMFPEALAVQRMHARLHAGPGAHRIALEDIALALPDTTIHAAIGAVEDEHGYGITIQADFPDLPSDRLSAYWPLKLAPITRIWAVGNIHRGMIYEARMEMQLRPEDLDAPSLPKAALRASMRIEGVEVKYLPTHPPARNVSGTVTFSGQDMRLEMTGVDYLSATHFDSGSLTIPSFDAPETALDAEFDLHTTAQDVATLFATPEIDLAHRLHLTAAASGTASGTVGIHAIIFSSKPNPTPEYYASQFQYRVKARLSGVGQPKFLGDTDIADARMDLSADNAGLSASGALLLNGVPAQLDLTADFQTDKDVTKVVMELPAAKLPAFGYPALPGVGGSIGVNATMTGGKNPDKTRSNVTEAVLDLTPTNLNLPQAGFAKPPGEKAILRMTTRLLPGGGTAIDPVSYQGKNATLNGNLTINAKGDVQALNIANAHMGRQNASIRYNAAPDGVPELYVRGASLDLVALRAEQDKHADHKKASNPLDPGPIRADVELERLWLTKEMPIEQLHAKLDCSRSFCASADIRGRVAAAAKDKIPAAPFALRILQENGMRRFQLEADDAGRLASALDVNDRVAGGALKLEGAYDDTKPTHPLIGKAHLGEFYVRQAPLLTKILSLTSPSGIVDAITGKGIGFDGLTTAFTFDSGTLHIKDARASGSALGLTAEEGSVQLGTGQIQMKGTVIPAYMLNSVIGKIPVIGDWLMGGKGQGLIATRFSLSGTDSDPNVSVNPLSILTPGFLRGVFDVFDKKEDGGGSETSTDEEAPSTTRRRKSIR